MDSTKTILEWLEALPKIEGCPSWREIPNLDRVCGSLSDAVTHVYLNCEDNVEYFWLGFSLYIDGEGVSAKLSQHVAEGYEAARVALGGIKKDVFNG